MGLLPTVPLFPHPHYSKARKPSRAYFINSFATWAPATRSDSADFSGLLSRGGRPPGEAGQRAAGRAQRLPRPGAVLALGASRLPQPGSPALGAQRRRHVFRGQRERPAAAGGAAQAGGRCGEDQGLAGSCRASTVLHAECLQGCPAGRCSSWKQPLPGAQILCFILKAVRKKFTEECF